VGEAGAVILRSFASDRWRRVPDDDNTTSRRNKIHACLRYLGHTIYALFRSSWENLQIGANWPEEEY